MRLLLIGGFLGSGKTTLLMRVARNLIDSSLRIAIIENEIGEIGIDNKYIRKEGLEVQEIFGGCICCTLQTDLIKTLRKIKQVIRPDWILLEPTGLANPGDILASVQQYVPEIDHTKVIVVADAVRYTMLARMMTPMVAAQIRAAHIVAVNKIDEADDVTLASVAESVSAFNGNAQVVNISAEKGTNVNLLLKGLR